MHVVLMGVNVFPRGRVLYGGGLLRHGVAFGLGVS